EFLGSGGAFLDAERLQDAVARRGELRPEQGRRWIAAIDPSFSQDPFAVAIVGRDVDDPERLVLGLARAWTPPRPRALTFAARRTIEDRVLDEVATTCLRFGV